MNKKIFLFFFLSIAILGILSGCATEGMNMDVNSESIDESDIRSLFPLDIDILNSDKNKKEVEEYLKKLNPQLNIAKSNYEFGDLDGDSIPELTLYIERDPENLEDQGDLIVYKLIDEEYKELDRVDMNYDNANNILKSGMLSQDQPGILLSNQVGGKAAVTYGYILENSKLKSILNPKRVNLISFYTMESIEDIDEDGILEFGIITVDPETEETTVEDAKKIVIWYRWDGIDGAEFVQKDVVNTRSMKLLRSSSQIDSLIPGSESFITGLQKNKDDHSKSEISSLLNSHIKNLEMNSSYNSLDIAALFSKHTKKTSLLDLLESYNLTGNRINDIDYIKRDKVLETEADLKSMLITNLEKGYYLKLDDGRYQYNPYYSKLAAEFSKSITKELQGYLNIMAKISEIPYLEKDVLLIDKIDLAKRLTEIENYIITYSYSDHIENIDALYKDYLKVLIFYSSDGEIITNSEVISQREIDNFINIVNSYPETYFSQLLNELLVLLDTNQNSLSPEMIKTITQMIR